MQIDLNISVILQSLAVLGIAGIFAKLKNIGESMAGMKVWQEQHEKQDNERHDTVMALIERGER